MGFSDRNYYRSEQSSVMSEWTAVLTIIVVNIAVWVGNLLGAVELPINDFLALQGDLQNHPLKIWELISYGFVHDATTPWHLVFNMLGLWFFGREVESLMGRAEFFRFYVTAIVLAGLTWLVSLHIGQPEAARRMFLVGASGAVMAVLAVFIWHYPRQTVLIYGVLPVPVWALGIFYFVSDVQGAASGGGQVANVAHLAGAVFGLCYAWRGWDLESLFDISNRLKQMRRRMRVVHPEDDFENGRGAGQSSKNRTVQSREETAEQQAVDTILEKISRSGESSLTAQERDTLTRASQRLKDRMR
ncbi:MAG: rhomboid family intramembrane serine protease [Planctomycetota bacterium]|nr:MAG: rhomboid family intramembrane serine protease [Planctomycetota bacterium]